MAEPFDEPRPPTRGVLIALANGLARLAASPVWDAEALMTAAERAAGHPLDRAAVAEPLSVLLQALDETAALSPLGRAGMRWDLIRLLSNRLRLAQAETADPSVLAEPVTAPIIITGLPRSGTTTLYALLAEDPQTLAPRCWQTMAPYPDPGARRDSRPEQASHQLRRFAALVPEFRRVHPFDGWSPQECTEITAHDLRSLRFDTTHAVPGYRRWLDAHGHDSAYRFHKRFLQHLQHQDRRAGAPGRWVLKSPDHLFALDALRAVYPDARLLFVHRDPMKVLPSVARLTEILRAPFARHVDRLAIGRQVTGDWALAADTMIAVDRDQALPAAQVAHVHYAEIVRQPLETVERLYQRFGLTLTPAARARMAARVAAQPDGGYGRNRYSPAAYGIEAEAVHARFAAYLEHFGIRSETAGRASPLQAVPAGLPSQPQTRQ